MREVRQRQRARRDAELRAGLPCFDRAFQQEWLAVNERFKIIKAKETAERDNLADLTSKLQAWKQHRHDAIWEALFHLIVEPINTLTIDLPVGAEELWKRLELAQTQLLKVSGLDAACRWRSAAGPLSRRLKGPPRLDRLAAVHTVIPGRRPGRLPRGNRGPLWSHTI